MIYQNILEISKSIVDFFTNGGGALQLMQLSLSQVMPLFKLQIHINDVTVILAVTKTLVSSLQLGTLQAPHCTQRAGCQCLLRGLCLPCYHCNSREPWAKERTCLSYCPPDTSL